MGADLSNGEMSLKWGRGGGRGGGSWLIPLYGLCLLRCNRVIVKKSCFGNLC